MLLAIKVVNKETKIKPKIYRQLFLYNFDTF